MHGLIRPVQLKRREAVGETSRVTWYQVPGGLHSQRNIRNILSAGIGKAQLHLVPVPVCNTLTIREAQLIYIRPLEVWSSQVVVTPFNKSIGVLDGDTSFGTKFEPNQTPCIRIVCPVFP